MSDALAREVRSAHSLLDGSIAASTLRAYESDWFVFERWCGLRGLRAFPATPEVVVTYMGAMADGSVEGKRGEFEPRTAATIARHTVSIGWYHLDRGESSPSPTKLVKQALRGMRRRLGTAPAQKAPTLGPMVREMVATIDDSDVGALRDRTIVLLGFAGAFRRSEIVSLNIEDVDFQADGVVIFLRRSKTDQEGVGRYVRVPRAMGAACPVASLASLIRERRGHGATDGPIFVGMWRSSLGKRLDPGHVALVVKRCVDRIGRDAAEFAGHSLRSGFVTSATRAGRPLYQIQEKTGHKSLDSLALYIRSEGDWNEDPGRGLLDEKPSEPKP